MRLSSAVPLLTPLRRPPGSQESQRQAALYPLFQEQTVQISIATTPSSPNHSWRAPQRGRSMRSARRFDIQAGRGIPQDPAGARADPEPRDYHFSHYSLAYADGGVCIDMTDGQVRFDWTYVPFFETPSAFASFARRLHFRNGHHVDEPARQIRVPRRPLGRME
jgi:hypothetical protein